MKEIWFSEMAPGHDFPEMKECLSQTSYPFQKEIVFFLKNGKIKLTRLSRAKDVFTRERIPYEIHIMTSGDYVWSNDLAWYVEKYNLRLPKDFEEYILKKLGIQ